MAVGVVEGARTVACCGRKAWRFRAILGVWDVPPESIIYTGG